MPDWKAISGLFYRLTVRNGVRDEGVNILNATKKIHCQKIIAKFANKLICAIA
jgi:hypothetical protein